jgi:hypothetical protein
MITMQTVILSALLLGMEPGPAKTAVAVAIMFGLAIGIVGLSVLLKRHYTLRSTKRGIPDYNPPPEPPRPPTFWRRVLVKDLKVGEVYRDRLSGNRVKVVRTRLFDPEKQRHLRDMADCTMWNAAKGCYQDVHLCDGDLETDDPMLDASEERRIARMTRLGP